MNIPTDSHESSPLRQVTVTPDNRRARISTTAAASSSRQRRGANHIFVPTNLSPSYVWRWSDLVFKASSVFLLVSWSTIVLSFRYAPTPISQHQQTPASIQILSPSNVESSTKKLRGNDKTAFSQDFLEDTKNSGPMKLSLWLIPPGGETEDAAETTNRKDHDSVFDRAQTVIDDLSTERSGPRFIPHITLGGARVASEGEALALAEKLRSGLSGFGSVECSFGDTVLSAPHAWNQAFVLELVPPWTEFLRLCRTSREILGMESSYGPEDKDDCLTFPPPLKVPHMSLYYGDSPPPPSQNYLSRVFGADSGSKHKQSFRAHRVMLWKTDPSSRNGVPQWEPLADISLL